MLRRARVRHSLGVAVAATALLAAGSTTALAQSPAAQTQEPETRLTPLSLFDNRLTKPTSFMESWLSGFEMKCVGCRGFETTAVRPDPTNATAPTVLQGKWRRHTPLGVVSTGFVGVRNYALPLSSAMPLGGDVDPAALRSAGTSAFAPASQWSLTAAVEKTLVTRASGASVGVTADLLIPVATNAVIAGDPRISASSTLRFGIVFRW
jgi:hypothetical protein